MINILSSYPGENEYPKGNVSLCACLKCEIFDLLSTIATD